ncbi:DUF4321 domain-containing protein [candidate division NPL-UPA2 bacterium]|nr:DUF4321 domain-containing protein [candidate division NPL-UPA2 bacterium]
MPKRRRGKGKGGIGFWLLVLIIGALIGSIAGEIIGLFFQDEASIFHKLFVAGIRPGFEPRHFNLYILDFTIGFHIKLSVTTLIGLIAAIYLGKLL